MIKASERPLSPHLTIYKPQLTSILSILHRLTGVIFFLGLIIVLWTIILSLTSCSCILETLNNISNTKLGKAGIFIWIYTMMLHTCGGIRYLFWSNGKGFELKQVEATAYAILIIALVLTAIIMLI